jgi:beta-glucosidase
MSFKNLRITACYLFAVITLSVNAQDKLPQLGKAPISEVIKAMTLEEKAKLVVGKGMNLMMGTADGPTVGQTEDQVLGAAGTTFAIPRLGIPTIVVADGPAGVRIDSVRKSNPGKTYYATAWPVGTLLASSWDTALVKKVGTAFGHEAKEYGIDIMLGPALNIHRNPLGGRNFEYFSEDPLVAGMMAAAMVNGIESNGVGTSIKHFAANNQETNRNTVNAIISERALREIYLKGFEIAVKKSQPWTVMSSYNLINGVFTSESDGLLTNILRKDWGFKGFVMTDWFGGKDAVAQMNAGNELLMPGTSIQTKSIIDAVKNGQLSEKVLDENIARMLAIILQCQSFKGYQHSDQPDLKKDAQIAREAAAESMVLLKNAHEALPIKKEVRSIALFGINGYELIAGGTGSGDVNKAYKVSLLEGLKHAGYFVDENLSVLYKAYLKDYSMKHPKKSFFAEFMNPTPSAPEYDIKQNPITDKAGSADLAIIVIGRNAGEGRDRKVGDDYELTETEKTLIKSVTDAFHEKGKKAIAVLNIGGVIEVAKWRDAPDAILLAWQPGLEGGNAIVDVLRGKVNPSGKLATTFPVKYADEPTAKNFPGKELRNLPPTNVMGTTVYPAEVTYEEGIYIGYRYFNSFGVKPAYEFGYGLSYSRFSYSNLNLSATTFSDKITASVTITNTGKVAGKEVVQLYLAAPVNKMDKPAEELKAFAKTILLNPGASQTISFTLRANDLASFNTAETAWIADAGNYSVKIGASSEDIKLSKQFSLAKDIVVEKLHKALELKEPINELKK